jgi:hypothetical protein
MTRRSFFGGSVVPGLGVPRLLRPARTAVLSILFSVSFLSVFVTAAIASKGVVATFGSSDTTGGQFSSAGSTAVNRSTSDVYVVDAPNNRVEQFDSSSAFIRAWGFGVALRKSRGIGENEDA